MLKSVGVLVLAFYLILWTPYTIYFNIVHISCKWKCRKKHYNEYTNLCHESDCRYFKLCTKYQHIYTNEEKERIMQLIADLKD